jgi:hypothetical protein
MEQSLEELLHCIVPVKLDKGDLETIYALMLHEKNSIRHSVPSKLFLRSVTILVDQLTANPIPSPFRYRSHSKLPAACPQLSLCNENPLSFLRAMKLPKPPEVLIFHNTWISGSFLSTIFKLAANFGVIASSIRTSELRLIKIVGPHWSQRFNSG